MFSIAELAMTKASLDGGKQGFCLDKGYDDTGEVRDLVKALGDTSLIFVCVEEKYKRLTGSFYRLPLSYGANLQLDESISFLKSSSDKIRK